MLRAFAVAGVLAMCANGVYAAYWVDWEGENWPEELGYERGWGNGDGQGHGPGANRTLANGTLTYDSLYDPTVADFYQMDRFGQMNPMANELWVLEWRLRVDTINGTWPMDPGIGAYSDDDWGIGFCFAENYIECEYEGDIRIAFTPHVWHSYRVVSPDMRHYDLYIDSQLVRHGDFCWAAGAGCVMFGDGCQSAGSVHEWDYFRFGAVAAELQRPAVAQEPEWENDAGQVLPEPGSLILLVWVLAWQRARRG